MKWSKNRQILSRMDQILIASRFETVIYVENEIFAF